MVREKFACRACEAITQPPAPFHPIARGRAGPNLLATIPEAKFGQHLPLNRQSESSAREGIELDVSSTLADWVGACTASLALLRAHVLAGERLHGDDTTVPVLAARRTTTGGCGSMCATTAPLPAPPRRRRCSATPLIARPSTPGGTLPGGAASCRPTPMSGSRNSTPRTGNRVR